MGKWTIICRFVDHVTVLYHEPPPWDEEGKYQADTVEVSSWGGERLLHDLPLSAPAY